MDDSTRVPPLAEYLAALPEFRAARGKRHPLLALLLLVGVATLCGARGQSGIAAWGRDHGQLWLRRLGFTRAHGPSQPTLHRLFGLDSAGWLSRAFRAACCTGATSGGQRPGFALPGPFADGFR